jgi:hypothetical protein
MIALIIVAFCTTFVWLPYIFFVELLSSLKLMLSVMDAAAHFSKVHKKKNLTDLSCNRVKNKGKLSIIWTKVFQPRLGM